MEEDNLVTIWFKKSWSKKNIKYNNWLGFDGWFGLIITIGNFMDGIFNSLSHTELDFHDGNFWSASESRDRIDPKTGKNNCGVGFKRIKLNPEKWLKITFDVTDKRLPKSWKSKDELRKYCVKRSGRDYDVIGCVGQAIQIDQVQDYKKDYCSEACGGAFDVKQKSPARLFNELEDILK